VAESIADRIAVSGVTVEARRVEFHRKLVNDLVQGVVDGDFTDDELLELADAITDRLERDR
jgi:hypothetical protein